eukprot:9210930-Alexandrium_andersonii.AAC.1
MLRAASCPARLRMAASASQALNSQPQRRWRTAGIQSSATLFRGSDAAQSTSFAPFLRCSIRAWP